MSADSIFTINSLKFGGKIHRSWKAEHLKTDSDLLIFKGIFENEVNHDKLGVIRRGTVSYEFFWKSRCYNVFRFHEPEGVLRNFYCNISQPPTLTDNCLSFIDLDVDVLVWKDLSYEILDLDEYEENSKSLAYPTGLREEVQKSLNEILILIEKKEFPFDYLR